MISLRVSVTPLNSYPMLKEGILTRGVSTVRYYKPGPPKLYFLASYFRTHTIANL